MYIVKGARKNFAYWLSKNVCLSIFEKFPLYLFTMSGFQLLIRQHLYRYASYIFLLCFVWNSTGSYINPEGALQPHSNKIASLHSFNFHVKNIPSIYIWPNINIEYVYYKYKRTYLYVYYINTDWSNDTWRTHKRPPSTMSIKIKQTYTRSNAPVNIYILYIVLNTVWNTSYYFK